MNHDKDHRSSSTSSTVISSVDYFLLDNVDDVPNHTPIEQQQQREQQRQGSTATSIEAPRLSGNTREPVSHNEPNRNDTTSTGTGNGTDSHTNRCRLGSSNTNISTGTGTSIGTGTGTGTGMNTQINDNSSHHQHHPYQHSVVERIYFDDHSHHHTVMTVEPDGMTEPTTIERGESLSSSYALFVQQGPTTPLLSESDDNNIINNDNNTTGMHVSNSNSNIGLRDRCNSNNSDNIRRYYNRRRTMSNQERYRREIPELSGLNILNAVSYTVHVIIWWTCGVWGVHHMIYTHWEQTQFHETLVTPSTWAANYLWIPILIAEGICTISQLLPHYRARPIITSGTSYFFFYTVLLQITYTFLYSFGLFIFSFICIVLALISILSLLASQQFHTSADMTTTTYNSSRNNSHYFGLIRFISGGNNNSRWLSSHRMTEYILFSFPFYLHAGWLILMAVDHFSLLFRRYDSTAIDVQLASDIVGLGILFVAAIYALNQPTAMGPDFVIPTVIVWSYVRIFTVFNIIWSFTKMRSRNTILILYCVFLFLSYLYKW
jgi:hypothetical protein